MLKQLIIFAFFAVLIFLGYGREIKILPEELYGCQLTSAISGEEAKAYVNHLHLQKVASGVNQIGFYEGENGPITIYLTRYESSDQAREDYSKMTQKISPNNSVFIAGEYLAMADKEVYRCFGMGQTHLVFVHAEHLIWLSVDTIRAPKILEAYLAYLE
jgi:hypothetical protein